MFLEDWIKNPVLEFQRLCQFLDISDKECNEIATLQSNASGQRLILKTIIRKLAKINFLCDRYKSLPKYLRNRIESSSLIYEPFVCPDIYFSDEYQNYITDLLKKDAYRFLERYDKPQDFWNWDF